MTNAQIVFNEQVRLMNDGVIGTTGNMLEMMDGSTMPEPEPIHTYAGWKRLGYQVRRGEKATASFHIWKYRANKKNDATEVDAEDGGRMFMTTAHFFTAAQVDKIRKQDPSEYVGKKMTIQIGKR